MYTNELNLTSTTLVVILNIICKSNLIPVRLYRNLQLIQITYNIIYQKVLKGNQCTTQRLPAKVYPEVQLWCLHTSCWLHFARPQLMIKINLQLVNPDLPGIFRKVNWGSLKLKNAAIF